MNYKLERRHSTHTPPPATVMKSIKSGCSHSMPHAHKYRLGDRSLCTLGIFCIHEWFVFITFISSASFFASFFCAQLFALWLRIPPSSGGANSSHVSIYMHRFCVRLHVQCACVSVYFFYSTSVLCKPESEL